MRAGALKLATALAATMLVAACGEEQYSTKYPCNFTFYTGYHPTSILNGITTNAGTFAIVSAKKVNGLHHVYVSRNDGGASEDWPMTTEIENKRLPYDYIGANNAIIVGYSTSMEAKAYDGQCPYCLANQSGLNYPLSWADNGRFVSCAKCGRKYNVIAEGTSTDGWRIDQYRITTGTGQGGAETLHVGN